MAWLFFILCKITILRSSLWHMPTYLLLNRSHRVSQSTSSHPYSHLYSHLYSRQSLFTLIYKSIIPLQLVACSLQGKQPMNTLQLFALIAGPRWHVCVNNSQRLAFLGWSQLERPHLGGSSRRVAGKLRLFFVGQVQHEFRLLLFFLTAGKHLSEEGRVRVLGQQGMLLRQVGSRVRADGRQLGHGRDLRKQL